MHPDSKQNILNQLCHLLERLAANYQQFCSQGHKDSDMGACMELLHAITTCSQDANISLDSFADSFSLAMAEARDPHQEQTMAAAIETLYQKVQKLRNAFLHTETSYNDVIIKNYFQTSFSQNALLIYIVYPFLYRNTNFGHTNQQEVIILAELLSAHGYNVDIISIHFTGNLDFDQYHLVLGSGRWMDECCSRPRKNLISIYYLTERSPYFSNIAELKRLNDFERRNHHRLDFERLSTHHWNLSALSCANAAVCIGNADTLSTYEGMFRAIYPVNVTGFVPDVAPDFSFSQAQNFMWYGGAGALHKGLDLCIEAFRLLPDLKLHIVGEPNAAFYQFYQQDIEQAENIFYYGFLNKDDDLFREACAQCAFCIMPSCSESQSAAMVTAMFHGMIPVGTPEVGIDYDACGGIMLEDPTVDAIAQQLDVLSHMSTQEIVTRRRQAFSYANTHHTPAHYRQQMCDILDDIILVQKLRDHMNGKTLKVQFLNGGLANQAFQYIFARCYELSHPGEIMYLDDSYFALNTVHNGYELENVFGIHAHMLSSFFPVELWEMLLLKKQQRGRSIPQLLCDIGVSVSMISEADNYKQFNPFDDQLIRIPINGYFPEIMDYPGNTYYHGYWINSGFFHSHEAVFRKEFTFPQITDAKNLMYLNQIHLTLSVSIHIRRGDFVSLNFAFQAQDYHKMICAFLRDVPGDWTLFVFSDDIGWCKDNYTDLGFDLFGEVIFIEGNTDGNNYIDLQLMSQCKGMILSNSSFCYLAALLNTEGSLILNPTSREL